MKITGLHHVTAITAKPQENLDFYTGTLGLRLVKLTVNFDDPGSYHLYYGDELGHPGSILTFFAWTGGMPGRVGPPQVTATAFCVPEGSLDYWASRLGGHNVATRQTTRFNQRVLQVTDPDEIPLEIVGSKNPAGQPWRSGPVPHEHAIRGFHSITISEEGYENTARLLADTMGFIETDNESNRFRYRVGPEGGLASIVDLLCVPDARRGSMGAGVVHHVAFRTPDDDQQTAWRRTIARLGLNVSPVMDRNYFHSIYYREPGGVLFEIATDNPGFAIDEPAEKLGTSLKLPPQFEPHREVLERMLPKLRLPAQ